MIMIRFIIIICVLMMAGCSPSYYYKVNPSLKNAKIFPITLDSTYELFTRVAYLEETENGLKKLNTSQVRLSEEGKRIEVEYLLISKQQKRCLYIPTVPDKYQKRYEKYFMQDTLNLYDGRVFYYGELTKNNKITFYSKSSDNDRDVWTYDENQGSISIIEVREYKKGELTNIISIEDALKNALMFTKSETYSIGYKNYFDNNPEYTPLSKTQPAAFIKEIRPKKYTIYFKMHKPISGFSHIKFLNRRVWYRPL